MMIYYVKKFLLSLMIVGVLICCQINHAMAQHQPQYECGKVDGFTANPADNSSTFNWLYCFINDPVDEKDLRLLAEKVYKEISGSKYETLIISWLLFLGPTDDIYLSDIGATSFKNGQLDTIYVPKVNDRDHAKDPLKDPLVDFFRRVIRDE